MLQTIYVSKATKAMTEKEILDILEESRERNKKSGITGMLLYVKENFFQVLEGEDKDVLQTYERIEKDQRHSNIILIEKLNISRRTFPEWSMGFKYLTDENINEVEGYSEFLNKYMEPEEFAQRSGLAVKLLYTFKNKNQGY